MEKRKIVKALIPVEGIINRILVIRGKKVLLDRDLAQLYGIETRVLKQAVRRNIRRFPDDFMFELTSAEMKNWTSQFVMSTGDKKGLRHKPFAFTEQGVAMLSSVLNSDRAIEINILIMRAFVKLREIIAGNKKIETKLRDLDKRLQGQEEKIIQIIQVLNQLMTPPDPPKKRIGFRIDRDDK